MISIWCPRARLAAREEAVHVPGAAQGVRAYGPDRRVRDPADSFAKARKAGKRPCLGLGRDALALGEPLREPNRLLDAVEDLETIGGDAAFHDHVEAVRAQVDRGIVLVRSIAETRLGCGVGRANVVHGAEVLPGDEGEDAHRHGGRKRRKAAPLPRPMPHNSPATYEFENRASAALICWNSRHAMGA
jgi:hypothetical protein